MGKSTPKASKMRHTLLGHKQSPSPAVQRLSQTTIAPYKTKTPNSQSNSKRASGRSSEKGSTPKHAKKLYEIMLEK
jgi:hypothetical protein